MTTVKNILSFSGGKDSTALILWARENLKDFDTVFCDTGWEHQKTYEYIEYINQTLLDGKLITLKSDKYDGFEDLSIKKGRVASVKARFCTVELKIKPILNFIKQFENIVLFNGIRADESKSRSAMPVCNYDATFNCLVIRPILYWTAEECFAKMKGYNIKPNPLYLEGSKRVGCYPCIMSNLSELKAITNYNPETWDKIKQLEMKVGRSFFTPNIMPERFQTGFDEKSGKKFPTIDDVINYVNNPNNDIVMIESEPIACMSHYKLCE